jgi:hypothetical protein
VRDVVHVIALAEDMADPRMEQCLHDGMLVQSGEHHDLQFGIAFAQHVQQLQAISVSAAGHGEVGDQHVAGLGIQQRDQFGRIRGRPDVQDRGNRIQRGFHRHPDHRMVICHGHADRGIGHLGLHCSLIAVEVCWRGATI